MTQMAFLIDLDRCCDTRGCVGACKQENNAALGCSWITTFTSTVGDFPDNETYFIPIMCQHCQNPPCIPACPLGAISKRSDGIVLIDTEKCPACAEKPCLKSCPYDAISYNAKKNVAEKCTLCVHLIDQGKLPACVASCCSNAYTFGDLDDPESDIARRIKATPDKVHYLNPETGAQPAVCYFLTNKTWQDMKGLRWR